MLDLWLVHTNWGCIWKSYFFHQFLERILNRISTAVVGRVRRIVLPAVVHNKHKIVHKKLLSKKNT